MIYEFLQNQLIEAAITLNLVNHSLNHKFLLQWDHRERSDRIFMLLGRVPKIVRTKKLVILILLFNFFIY